jgi:predicted metal-binding protein
MDLPILARYKRCAKATIKRFKRPFNDAERSNEATFSSKKEKLRENLPSQHTTLSPTWTYQILPIATTKCSHCAVRRCRKKRFRAFQQQQSQIAGETADATKSTTTLTLSDRILFVAKDPQQLQPMLSVSCLTM